MVRLINSIISTERRLICVVKRVLLLAMLLTIAMPLASAATIEQLQLLSAGNTQQLHIGMDAAAPYQVFNLEAPKRLVLLFPQSKLASTVKSLPADGMLRAIRPLQDGNGARIEITLAKGARYHLQEQGNDLLVKFTAPAATAQQHRGAVLQDMSVVDHNGTTELILRGTHMDANRHAMVTNGGNTMVIDFWGGESRLPKSYYAFSAARLNHVTVGEAKGRVRLVVSLRNEAGNQHQIHGDSHQLVVRFGSAAALKPVAGQVVESVDFRPQDRIAHLMIRTSQRDPEINLQQQDDKIILDFKHASLASGQERSQDVQAFPGPVKQIDSYRRHGGVRVVVRLREKSKVTSFQAGNLLTVMIKPEDLVAKGNGQGRDTAIYSGQKVDFKFQNMEVRNALQLIAEMSGMNIIMSDDVTGKLTMHLIDVPWDQALDLILSSKGLGKQQIGNVIRIAPLEKLKADADAQKRAKKSAESVAPLETEFFQLGYVSVEGLKSELEGFSSKSTSDSGASSGGSDLKLLSERGTIIADKRSNTLIVTDTRERLNNIKRLLKVLDRPEKQVLIEARIVEASDTFSRDLGVKWGGKYTKTKGRLTHTIQGANGLLGNNVVDLGAAVAGTGGAIGYTIGSLGGALNLNLELSAAEQEGEIKVVSSPRVFTSNLQEAIIEQDQQVPFTVTTISNGGTTTATELKSAKLTLKVTPQITADKRIFMLLEVNKDTPTQFNGQATIDKKLVKTKLLVKNGDTVVLGGIYTQNTSDSVTGVPGLMDIPILGNLFKRKQKVNNRSELLIFITPTVVEEQQGAGE